MDVTSAIYKRKSVRAYKAQPIEKEKIQKLLQAGICAPSGKNGQPWRFAVVHQNKELLRQIADLTIYKNFVSNADCLICVFLDKRNSYHYVKDCQAIGACIENILLAATAENLGACWIGEILNRAAEVCSLLQTDPNCELMAVIALGYPNEKSTEKSTRKNLNDCILKIK